MQQRTKPVKWTIELFVVEWSPHIQSNMYFILHSSKSQSDDSDLGPFIVVLCEARGLTKLYKMHFPLSLSGYLSNAPPSLQTGQDAALQEFQELQDGKKSGHENIA